MNLLHTNRINRHKAGDYAMSEEFRNVFTEDMAGLYLLSFLLVASHEKAERCFIAGLEDCVKRNSVFREWARSWAKRMIIHNAIQIMTPHPSRGSGTPAGIRSEADRRRQQTQEQNTAIASILTLGDFDRFVFVMSVLERYSEKECSTLLGCSRHEVREARMRTPLQIAEYIKDSAAGQGDAIRSSVRSPELRVH